MKICESCGMKNDDARTVCSRCFDPLDKRPNAGETQPSLTPEETSAPRGQPLDVRAIVMRFVRWLVFLAVVIGAFLLLKPAEDTRQGRKGKLDAALAAATAIGRCVKLGVAMMTASISGSLQMAAKSVVTLSMPQSCLRAASSWASASQAATSLARGSSRIPGTW